MLMTFFVIMFRKCDFSPFFGTNFWQIYTFSEKNPTINKRYNSPKLKKKSSFGEL